MESERIRAPDVHGSLSSRSQDTEATPKRPQQVSGLKTQWSRSGINATRGWECRVQPRGWTWETVIVSGRKRQREWYAGIPYMRIKKKPHKRTSVFLQWVFQELVRVSGSGPE